MIFVAFAVVTVCLLGFADATMSWGKCSNLRLVDHFKLESYTGLWYEQLRDKNFRFEKGDCQESRYALMDEEPRNNTIYVLHSQFVNDKVGFQTSSGVAKCEGAKCRLKYHRFMPEGDYRILDTDYKTYSIVYSCRSVFGVSKNEFVWLLTREADVEEAIISKARAVISDRLPWYNLNNLYYTK